MQPVGLPKCSHPPPTELLLQCMYYPMKTKSYCFCIHLIPCNIINHQISSRLHWVSILNSNGLNYARKIYMCVCVCVCVCVCGVSEIYGQIGAPFYM